MKMLSNEWLNCEIIYVCTQNDQICIVKIHVSRWFVPISMSPDGLCLKACLQMVGAYKHVYRWFVPISTSPDGLCL